MVTTPVKKPNAFDAFVHLVAYFALVMSAVAVGGIAFFFINRYAPDLSHLGYDYYNAGEPPATGAVRFHIASLLLTGPLLLILTGYLHRLFGAGSLNPASGVRRWLTYVLLFAAAVNIIGSVIALVYQFLGGNYTTNFLLKAGTVLLIAAAIFGFYFWELRRERYDRRAAAATAVLASTAVLFAVLLATGFAAIGSPLEARRREFDLRRADAAMQVRWRLEEEYRRRGSLPDALQALDPNLGLDPETGQPFPYTKLSDYRYRLCVTFARATPAARSARLAPRGPVPAAKFLGPAAEEVWVRHGAGEECHTFTLAKRPPEQGYVETEVENDAVPLR